MCASSTGPGAHARARSLELSPPPRPQRDLSPRRPGGRADLRPPSAAARTRIIQHAIDFSCVPASTAQRLASPWRVAPTSHTHESKRCRERGVCMMRARFADACLVIMPASSLPPACPHSLFRPAPCPRARTGPTSLREQPTVPPVAVHKWADFTERCVAFTLFPKSQCTREPTSQSGKLLDRRAQSQCTGEPTSQSQAWHSQLHDRLAPPLSARNHFVPPVPVHR